MFDFPCIVLETLRDIFLLFSLATRRRRFGRAIRLLKSLRVNNIAGLDRRSRPCLARIVPQSTAGSSKESSTSFNYLFAPKTNISFGFPIPILAIQVFHNAENVPFL